MTAYTSRYVIKTDKLVDEIYAMPPIPTRFIAQRPPISEERAGKMLEKAQARLDAAMAAANGDRLNEARALALSAESWAMTVLRYHLVNMGQVTLARNIRATAKIVYPTADE